MTFFRSSLFWIPIILEFMILGYFLVQTAVPGRPTKPSPGSSSPPIPRTLSIPDNPIRFKPDRARNPLRLDEEAVINGALGGQRNLQFKDQSAMERFLNRATGRVRILDRIDGLNAVRAGFLNYGDLAEVLDGEEQESFIFPVVAPNPADGDVQAGAASLGAGLHQWLGIEGDNSQWGRGVKIAVLDSSIQPHSAFAKPIQSISLAESSHGHGTAVASIIAGSHPATPGVAPAADLLSIGIADEEGVSDSFQLAKGILTAVENGADLINISMGSFGDSRLVREAIENATAKGIPIIAAPGNNGIDRVTYPAANEGVIAVGAVDALANHLQFSNTGEAIDVSAPGFAVNAAWPGENAIEATGTSFSAPVISGSIAAVMTEAESSPITANEAWERIQSVLNEAGPHGPDPQVGDGVPDLGRVFEIGVPGIHDAAVSGHHILPPSQSAPNGMLETTVQNRGTETLINTTLSISVDGHRSLVNLTTLAPNESRAIRIPLSSPPGENAITAISTVSLSGGVEDSKRGNDRRESGLTGNPENE